MHCSFSGTTMCKLIMHPTNLMPQFQQKQLIVFSFSVTQWAVFVLLIKLVWTRGPVWTTSGGRELYCMQVRSYMVLLRYEKIANTIHTPKYIVFPEHCK